MAQAICYGKTNLTNFLYFSLTCRCLERLNRISNGNLSVYNQFTIENYGECWSSRIGHDSLHSLTRSNNCIGAGYLECQQESPDECTGIELSSFLYQIHDRTKLLDEHCHIVKRIVCPSLTIQRNSSLPSQLPSTDHTAFINSTRTQQFTTSQLQISSFTTTFVNSASSREHNSSLLVFQSSEIDITSKGHNLTSSEVLQNLTHTLQHTNSQFFLNSTASIYPTFTRLYNTHSQSFSPSLTVQSTNSQLTFKSVNASFQGSRTVFKQTDSMLSQLQTLNTGLLYTSGSRFPSIILAPTQFSIISSTPNATTATELSFVESSIAFHSSDNSHEKSSQTPVVMITPSIAEKITNISYIRRSSTEVESYTSRLNVVVSSINTSPIQKISPYSSQSMPSIISTLMTSRSPWQPNATRFSSPTQQSGPVISKLLSKSHRSNIFNSSTIKEPRPILSSDLPYIRNYTTSDSFSSPWSTVNTGLFNISNQTITSSSKNLRPTFSENGVSNLIQNTIARQSRLKPSLQLHGNASSFSSTSSLSDIDFSNTAIKETNYSTIKQMEKTQTFIVSSSLPIEEKTSIVMSRISKPNEITSSREISRESHTSIPMQKSLSSLNETKRYSAMLSYISTDSMTYSKTSLDHFQSVNNVSPIEQSSLTTPSTTSKIECRKSVCEENSVESHLSKTFVILITQFTFILLA